MYRRWCNSTTRCYHSILVRNYWSRKVSFQFYTREIACSPVWIQANIKRSSYCGPKVSRIRYSRAPSPYTSLSLCRSLFRQRSLRVRKFRSCLFCSNFKKLWLPSTSATDKQPRNEICLASRVVGCHPDSPTFRGYALPITMSRYENSLVSTHQ
jgi:hypothetical protein